MKHAELKVLNPTQVPKPHPDHTRELHRVNRAMGQLEGVRRMIAQREYCPDIIVQVRAVTAALKGLEGEIMRRHLKHCLRDASASQDEADFESKLEEIVELMKK